MKKNKYILIIVIIVVIAIVSAAIISLIGSFRVIGTVSGAEFDYIVIDDVTYRINYNTGFSIADKGTFLGLVTNGDVIFRVYSVKGDTEGKYLYTLWDWEGNIYERETVQ